MTLWHYYKNYLFMKDLFQTYLYYAFIMLNIWEFCSEQLFCYNVDFVVNMKTVPELIVLLAI